MKKRGHPLLVVCLLLLVSIGACVASPISPSSSSEITTAPSLSPLRTPHIMELIPSESAQTTPPATIQKSSPTPIPSPSPTPTASAAPSPTPTINPTPMPDDSDVPRFATLSDARDYLREASAQCPETISIYLNNLSELLLEPDWTTWVRELLMEYSFRYTTDVTTGLLTVEPVYYAGTRILHAAETGDFSFLTPEELSAYNTATTVVNQAKANASSELQLEKALHDYLCQTVTYVGFEDVTLPTDNTPHTILTAVGALVYGQANCQGFSDAFYLLGELAGFQVRRQDGWDTGEPHRWNTIERNGQWYIVDVTYDASSGDAGSRPLNYQWFNVGLDLCVSRTWNTVSETAPVASVTDPSLFYYTCGEPGFGTAFTDVNEMAAYLYETRKNQGQSTFYTMLVGQELTWEALSDAVSAYANPRPIVCSWNIWTNSGNGYTFYLLDWTQWDP